MIKSNPLKSIDYSKLYNEFIKHSVFSGEHKCSPENSEKPTLAFRFISVNCGV